MCGFTAYLLEENDKEIAQQYSSYARRIDYRGPDQYSHIVLNQKVNLHFQRLAIMDLSTSGMQPFISKSGSALVCNGEIYNFEDLKKDLLSDHEFHSTSDCEVILPLYKKVGIEKTCKLLDGEFAFVIWDEAKQSFIAARDQIGIRPLFFGKSLITKQLCFSSEIKVLKDMCEEILPFPPGSYFDGQKIIKFEQIEQTQIDPTIDQSKALSGIKHLLEQAVIKRLNSDAKVGFLLSGGLDSSLVCAIAAKASKGPINTFAVGIKEDPIDTKYARIVAKHIGSNHHEYLFSKSDILEVLSDLIYRLETFDITTIRASIGMDLICKYIRTNTAIKVLMTGECSDELFGYKYTDFAPNPSEFQNEAIKRIKELYIYDVLRADRCISSNSLEARVPFSDKAFVRFVMSIPPSLKMNFSGHGKYLLRAAFDLEDYLPHEILYRDKAAFSDAVGHSSVDFLKSLAAMTITDDEMSCAHKEFPYCTPKNKEAYLYRKIFSTHFKDQEKLIPQIWMPNLEWENCDVEDPSARVLPNYGKSGV
ncbi:asparagine synthase B [Halobacteriovorax sp. HLS]|uniref:asparagine synthase B n=1 Tax=Halobacteriovorax sp. HLS TaxID=2234000 RepID=UPI000FD872F5|nr:asparagine synthase B [Halobacteriovorax sp. HLS]